MHVYVERIGIVANIATFSVGPDRTQTNIEDIWNSQLDKIYKMFIRGLIVPFFCSRNEYWDF